MKSVYFILAVIGYVQAISNGRNTTIMRHQWQLSLRHKGEHFCGAALIAEEWALTTASCLDIHSKHLSVRAGSVHRTSGGKLVDVDSFEIHPKYNNKTHNYDIALLKFAHAVEGNNISRALIPFLDTSDVPDGIGVSLTGWGVNKTGGELFEVLQRAYPSSISRSSCQMAYPTKIISLNMFCTGAYNIQNMTACHGDFGGPAVVISNCMQGIISWGGKCGSPKKPTVMTRIAAFKNWIIATTGVNDFANCRPNDLYR